MNRLIEVIKYFHDNIAPLCGVIVLFCMLTGCGGSTGWRFEVGVSPVKQLDNRAGLTQSEPARYQAVKSDRKLTN